MTDLKIIISERTGNRLDCLLNTIEAHLTFSASEQDTIDALRYALTEARNTIQLKERLAALATDEGEGPPPGDAYYEA